ncbi:MAG: DUF4830 domain-containing protein [Oscillospiraceae bacterium]|nr:DUF4830 domain-containing protein [Oscillospiraceae bacterium]
MMVMTAKVDLKKIAIAAAAVVGIIIVLVALLGGGGDTAPTAAASVTTNDGRLQFLKSFGWEVAASPVESSQVKIPAETSEVFERYNALQKSQGYDLTGYAGKTAMRYVYKINNYPGASEPVYATLLVYKDKIIGGDVTNTAAKGVIQGFAMPQTQSIPEPTQATAPTQPTTPTTP